jgi:Uma2 family endonuclease
MDGTLPRTMAGDWVHERIVMRLAARLGAFVEAGRLGDLLGSNALFILPNGSRRAPDLSFVAADRLAQEASGQPFPRLAPDLAIEVLSRGDRPRKVLDAVGEYLQAGVRLVWVIESAQRQAAVYRGKDDVHIVGALGSLDGEGVIPGFSCPLAEIFG